MQDLVSLPLTIMFNGSVDVISLSTVLIDWVYLVSFFSYWVILTSLFEWKLLFSLLWLCLSLTTFSNKRVIMELLLFSSSCRKVISFSIWWRSFSMVFWSLWVDFWHRKSLLNCKTSVIKECLKELNCSQRLYLNLSTCNGKTSKSHILLLLLVEINIPCLQQFAV